jgi:hypothetical protein
MQVPVYFLVMLGCHMLGQLLFGVLNFVDFPEEAIKLQQVSCWPGRSVWMSCTYRQATMQEIQEARDELKSEGLET